MGVDRALSFFGVYDIFSYLASGTSLVVGVWWVVEGEIPHLSVAGLLGLIGAGYLAGQIAAILGDGWERRWWRWRRGKPYERMLDSGAEGFGEDLRSAITSDLEADVGLAKLSTKQQFNLARIKLRLVGVDDRAETMRALHGLCRNLTASAAVVLITAAGSLVVDGSQRRLWIAAALALIATLLFGLRAVRFECRFGREVWLGYLALRMRSDRDAGP